jgi:hypothetical protein
MKFSEAPDPRKLIPPYAPYRSFRNYLDSLKQGIPSQIDRSVMRNMSGALQSQLAATLRYLGLVNIAGQPTERLSRVVNSEGPERKTALHDLAKAAYPYLFQGFDLKTATPKMLADKFAEMNAGGGTIGKCVGFFISLAKEAEIPLAPHLVVTRGNRTGKPRRFKPDQQNPQTTNGPEGMPLAYEVTSMPWNQLLLSKFPSFDPTWPDEVKTKWFDGFHRLMRQGPEAKEKEK